jgi:riboflavin kinase/FMN adenylyltransferase
MAAVLRFTPEVAAMTAGDFIREYLLGYLGMRCFVVGYDHGFGKNRDASSGELPEYARELGFELEVVPPVTVNGLTVKSSTIRTLLESGDARGAAMLLGRDYSLGGVVAHGKGNGHTIGIPTANLAEVFPEKIVPAPGVYAGWAEFDGCRWPGVISVGPRPTFHISEEAIEIHIPGFSGDLYGRPLRVGFTGRLRDIRPFDSREALVEQIHRDIEALQQFTVHIKKCM